MRKFISVLSIIVVIVATAFLTYRATMHNIIVEIESSNTVVLSVWGQSDDYYCE